MDSTREQAMRQAAQVLAGYGMRCELAPPDALSGYLPFRHFATPDACVVRAVGALDTTRVELYQYDYTSCDSDGVAAHGRTLLACVHHPWVRGGASITLDWKQWSSLSASLDAAMWFPPFVLGNTAKRLRSMHVLSTLAVRLPLRRRGVYPHRPDDAQPPKWVLRRERGVNLTDNQSSAGVFDVLEYDV